MPRMGRGHLEGRAIFFPELSGPTRWARSTYFSRAIEIRSSEVPDEGMTLSWLSETSREAAVHAGGREFQRVATSSGRSQSRCFSTGLVKPLLGKGSLQMTYHRLGVRPDHCF